MDYSIYNDINTALSYQDALMYFILGERGVGKTYPALRYVGKRYEKAKEEFVYLRRFKTELNSAIPTLFNPLNANKEFKEPIYNEGKYFKQGKNICGYAIPLTTASILKSVSFEKVKYIIFDEFIIDKGNYHYLHNEVVKILELVETIARLRDIKIIFLANSISTNNPYFLYFGLRLPYNSNIATFKNGLIVLQYIRNEKYREVKRQTKFGKLIDGTEYGNYAINNEFLRDNKAFIKNKTFGSRHFFNLNLKGNILGVWINPKDKEMFISATAPNCPST